MTSDLMETFRGKLMVSIRQRDLMGYLIEVIFHGIFQGYEWDTHGRLLKIDGFNNKTFTVIGDGVYIPFPVWGSSEFFSFCCQPDELGVRLTHGGMVRMINWVWWARWEKNKRCWMLDSGVQPAKQSTATVKI